MLSTNYNMVNTKLRIYLPDWVGGWVGVWVDGDQNSPSILLKIEYSNKQGTLIPNLASKIVYGH